MFTAREKYDDAIREMKLRQKVYGRMVNVGKLTLDLAQRRIAIMEEIASEYKELMKQEDLFREDPVPSSRTKADRRHARPPDSARQDHAGEPRQETPAENRERTDTAQTNQGRASGGETGSSSELPHHPGRSDG